MLAALLNEKIKTNLDIDEINRLIKSIISQESRKYKSEDELLDAYDRRNITREQLKLYLEEIKKNKDIKLPEIKKIKQHYYNPLLLATNDSKEYFKNIIREDSEIEFFNKLVEYSEKKDNKLKKYDWWYFSKLVENIDEIKIPYFEKYRAFLF